MKSILARIITMFTLCILVMTSTYSQTITLAPKPVQNKLDPLLQQAMFLKKEFPEKAVTAVEYYTAAKSPIEGVGDVIGILIQSNDDIRSYVTSLGGVIGSRHGNIYTALVPISKVADLAQSQRVKYMEASRKLFPSLDLSRAKTGADVLQQLANPAKKLTGKGIIIGFTDSGINTLHPNFKTPEGKTRILYIWDQYGTGGLPPSGFSYGIEKDSSAINKGTYYMYDDAYHGTHVSGIAAGNGLPNKQYVGMAPEADIIMVANKGDDLFNRGVTTVGTLDGYDYIRTKANALHRRHVINTSEGTNLGPHDGTTLFEKAMDADVAAGSIICLSAGNEATSSRHASAIVTTGSAKEIECYISEGTGAIIPMDIWYNTNDRLNLQIKKSSDASYVTLFPAVDSTIVYNFDVMQVTVTTKIVSPLNGDNEIYITFTPTSYSSTNFKLKFSAASGNTLPDGGRVDLWWERNYSVQFTTNVDQTITFGIPAGSDSAITVASYNNRSGYGGVEDISYFSGRGPRRDGKMKPDIAGIGGDVISSVSSNSYTSFSGTSMSSPHAAGAVALLLQQDTSLTSYQIKEKLKSSAIADAYTGTVPNGIWGYGKLNVLKAAGYKGFILTNVTPDSANFGSVFVSTQKNKLIKIKNLGYSSVNITSITPSNPKVSVNKSSFSIPARSEDDFTVSVLPTDTGSFNSSIQITSDDTTSGPIILAVTGRGDYEPNATITPDSLKFVVNEGDSTNSTVNISNSGQGPLSYSIDVDYQFPNTTSVNSLANKIQQPWGSDFKATVSKEISTVSSLPLLPLVLKDPVDDASGVDIIEVRGEAKQDSLYIQIVTATYLNPSNFNGIVGLDIDQNQATGRKLPYGLVSHDIGCDFYFNISGLYSYSIYLYDSSGYSITNLNAQVDTAGKRFTIAIPLNILKNDEGIIDIAGVFGSGTFATDYVPNAGHGTIGLQWLLPNPLKGIVASSGSEQINVKVRTRDLDGGNFKAKLLITTNDPDKLNTIIPVDLTVIGNPNIVVIDSLKYPTVYLGYPDTLSLIIGNNGTDNLTITNMTLSDPQLSIVGSKTFTIQKNKSRVVGVVFNPVIIGSFNGSISIESNDPGSPTVTVYVKAKAAHPPIISVTPDSLAFVLNEKDSAYAAVTISNSGVGALYWSVNKLNNNIGMTQKYTLPGVNISARNPDHQSSTDANILAQAITNVFSDLTGKRIGISNFSYYSILNNDLVSRGAKLYPIYYPITPSALDSFDVLAIDDAISGFSSSDISAIRSWIESGHGILLQADDQSSMININTLIAGTNIFEYSLGNYYDGFFTDVTAHQITENVDTVVSGAYGSYCDVNSPAMVLVRDYDARPHIAISTLGSGRVVAACNEIAGDFNFISIGDTRVLSNNIFDWLSGGGFFTTVVPDSGTVAPGNSQEINVKANARSVVPGKYQSSIALYNNDPAHNPKNIQVSMHVIGKPVIDVVPDTLLFGEVFVNILHSDTLVIKNIGSDQLKVTDIVSPDTLFHFDKKVFTVEQHSQENVAIWFTPHDTGSIATTFTISTNDSSKLTVSVHVFGLSVYPPHITTTPDSFSVSVDEGDSTIQTLTIGNTGLGVLHWEVPLSMRSSFTSIGAAEMNERGLTPRTPEERLTLREQQKKSNGSNKGDATISSYSLNSLLSSTGTLRVLLWTTYGDKSFGGEVENTMNAIKLFKPDIQFDTSQTTSPSAFASKLKNADVLIIPEQEQNTDLTSFGISFSSALQSFVESGRTMIVLDHVSGGATSFLNATGLLSISVMSTGSDYPAIVDDAKSPLVVGVTSPFYAMNGCNYHTSINGKKIIKEQYSGNNIVTVRDAGIGIVVYIGMDFYSYNTDMARLLANAVGTTRSGGFVTVEPGFGDVAPSSAVDVSVKIQAKTLQPGDFQSNVVINNNDLLRNPKIIPVKFHVTGKPIIDLAPDSLINLSLFVGIARKETLHVRNKGTEILTVSNILTTDSTVKVNKTSFNVEPGNEGKVLITITAGDTGIFSKKIVLTTNDSKKLSIDFPVKGSVQHPPIFSTSSDTLFVHLIEGDSMQQPLTLSNTGLGELQWEVAGIFQTNAGSIATASLSNAVISNSGQLVNQNTKTQNRPSHDGPPTVATYSLQDLLSQSASALRILVWSDGMDSTSNYYLVNSMNAIKQFRPDVKFDTSTTTSASVFASQLNTADVFIMPPQYYLWDLSSLGSSFSSALNSFIQSGHTVIVLDAYPAGATSFLNGTGLLNISVVNWGSFTAIVHDNSNALVDGVASTFYSSSGSNFHTSTNGSKIVREQSSGNNIVTMRTIGSGNIVYMGMDFYSYNSDMARILSNAAGLSRVNNMISIIPDEGVIASGGSQDLSVKCNAKNIVEGNYTYVVQFSSNDPLFPIKDVAIKIKIDAPLDTVDFVLRKGLNLISWSVRTELDSVSDVFSPVMNKVASVISFNAGEKRYLPGNPSSSTLKKADYLHGYWVTMTDSSELHLKGRQAKVQTPMILPVGYNLVSYLGRFTDTVRYAFKSILNNVEWIMSYSTEPLVFDPKVPSDFNTLKQIKPGMGYWIKLKAKDTLIFPLLAAASVPTNNSLYGNVEEGVIQTREWINVWGKDIKIADQLVPPGTMITATDESGTVCGRTTFFANGKFGMMPVFRDDSTTEIDEGVLKNEFISFTIGDHVISRKLQWKNFGDVVDFGTFLLGVTDEALVPKVFALHQNYPNPFNPTTTIKFDIPITSHVSLEVYNILGKHVYTLVNEEKSPGYYSLTWNAQTQIGTVASGVYFARIRAGEFVKTMKMVLIK